MNFSPTLLQAKNIIDAPVYSNSGTKIGKIKDVAIYDRNGITAYLITEILESNLGRNKDLFAVPWSMFGLSKHENNLAFTIERDALINAPSFLERDWNKVNQNNLILSTYNHFSKKDELTQHVDKYNLSNNKGLGNSGKSSSIREKSEMKTTIERAGINDSKKEYMY